MTETDPVEVQFIANPAGLLTGAEQAKQAMRDVGNEADRTSVKFRGVDSQTRSLFRTMVEFRVAAMSVENVMKAVGIQNEYANKAMQAVNLTMDVGIAVMAVYRGALAAKALAHWIVTESAAAEAIAEGALIVPFVGAAIALAGIKAAWLAIKTYGPPQMAQGGIVMPRRGGTPVIVGEAGYPEAIVPLRPGVSYGDTHVTMNVYSNDPDYISRQLARLIEQRKNAGYS